MQALCHEQFSITELTYPEFTKIDTGFMPRTIFYYWALTKIDSLDVVMHCNTLCNPEWSELIDTLIYLDGLPDWSDLIDTQYIAGIFAKTDRFVTVRTFHYHWRDWRSLTHSYWWAFDVKPTVWLLRQIIFPYSQDLSGMAVKIGILLQLTPNKESLSGNDRFLNLYSVHLPLIINVG